MKKRACPQCGIPSLYIKNDKDEILAVYIIGSGEIIPKDATKNIEEFDTTQIFCFGCSFNGSANKYK